MRLIDVEIGAVYSSKVSSYLVPVQVIQRTTRPGFWWCKNLLTQRELSINFRRFRARLNKENADALIASAKEHKDASR